MEETCGWDVWGWGMRGSVGGSNLGKEVRLGLGGWMIDGLSAALVGIENWAG